jgi:hypothetical protein
LKISVSSPRLRLTLTTLAIFLLALLPRLSAIDRSVTPDELHWVDRSLRFSAAIAHGQWADTVQAGHPGVTTLWLGSFGIAIQRLITPSTALPDLSTGFAPQDAAAMRALAQFLTAARLPVIFVTSFNITLLFLLLGRVVDRRAAFVAVALLALDPFAISLGSILHVDSLLTTFSLASLAGLGVAIDQFKTGMGMPVLRPTRWLILSGALAGLAMLSKSPAIMLAPAVFVILGLDTLQRRRSLWHFVRALLIWGATAAIVFVALYPAMWAAPKAAWDLMSNRIETFSETAHAVNYFFGSHDRDPGAAFYPAVIAYRSTPVLFIGLVAAIGLIVRARSDEDQRLRETGWMYWVFAVLFLGVITLGAKKLDRYVLPALEAFNVVGAFGLMFAANRLLKRRWAFGAVIGLALAITVWQFISVWPLTLRAYNLLLGGYASAGQALPVGGGEGEEVASALASSPFASKRIAVSDVVGTAPFYSGELVLADDAGMTQADYLLVNTSDFQLMPAATQAWIGSATPVLTITVQHQPFAWLYPNQWLAADRQRLIDQRQSSDAVIVDYPAALPVRSADPAIVLSHELTDAEAIAVLNDVAKTHTRVFFFDYHVTQRRFTSTIGSLLDTFAINLEHWSSPLGEGTLYGLPAGVSFNATPTPLNADLSFGDHVRLAQAALIVPHVLPGQTIGVVTDWIAAPPDVQAIVSLVDDHGHEWSRGDARVPISLDGAPGLKRIGVPAPLVMPPGDYELIMNAVDLDSGSPLPIRAGDRFAGFDWPLGVITIDPAQTFVDPRMRIPPVVLNADVEGIRAIGSDRPPKRIVTGDPWTLTMDWASRADHLPALDVRWSITSGGSIMYSTTMPLSPYSTDRWRAGEVIESKYDFRLPITLANEAYSLTFQLIDRAAKRPLNPSPITLAPIKLTSRSRIFTLPSTLDQQLDFGFGDLARLIGGDVDRSDNAITVTLYWQAQSVTATNATVFVQLVKPDGSIVRQIDNWQIAGDAPTSTWTPGQIIADPYTFDHVPAGAYQVWIGVYDTANGQRLAVSDSAGHRLPDDRALAITIK